MKRYLLPLCGALFVAGCFGGSSTSVPRDQTNACNILSGRSDWGEALSDAQSRWGAPPEVVMAIIWKESSFRSDARTPKKYRFFGLIPNGRVSSAFGYSQALDGTWEWYQDETGNGWADREDFGDATDFIGWYMTKTRRSNGLAMTDAYNQYLAYHEGHTGYKRGKWKSKTWLKGAAAKVSTRAAAYGRQLQGCSHHIT